MNSLYKYVSPTVLDRVLPESPSAVFKCSYPRAFNDPYELFLSIDLNEEPDLLAFYAETIGELPQFPTTCFSRSPDVLPMWAHYAQSLQGFVVEVDEARLAEHYPDGDFGDVDYRDAPDPKLNELLEIAYTTTKPRHTYFLKNAVFSAAYYTKATCWAYERERRMIVRETDVVRAGRAMLLNVPRNAISAIVCGARATKKNRAKLLDRAEKLGCRFLEMKIGRTSTAPYFLNAAGRATVYREEGFAEVTHRCTECGEPIADDVDRCSICRVDEAHMTEAARRNPFRLLERYGMLPRYLQEMDAIRSGQAKLDTGG